MQVMVLKVSVLVVLFCFSQISICFADEQLEEVNNLKLTALNKLDKIKSATSIQIIANEIKAIQDLIENSNNLIKEGDYEKASYVISIAMVYFNLIEAKIDYNNSENEIKDIKNKMD